jgi:prevent-host-death family protein
MDKYDIKYASEHLDELTERAKRGEDVLITVPARGAFRLLPVSELATLDASNRGHPRVTDTMPPFVPLKEPRKLGHLEGRIPPPPDGFFDPLTDEELKDWYGDDE